MEPLQGTAGEADEHLWAAHGPTLEAKPALGTEHASEVTPCGCRFGSKYLRIPALQGNVLSSKLCRWPMFGGHSGVADVPTP